MNAAERIILELALEDYYAFPEVINELLPTYTDPVAAAIAALRRLHQEDLVAIFREGRNEHLRVLTEDEANAVLDDPEVWQNRPVNNHWYLVGATEHGDEVGYALLRGIRGEQ